MLQLPLMALRALFCHISSWQVQWYLLYNQQLGQPLGAFWAGQEIISSAVILPDSRPAMRISGFTAEPGGYCLFIARFRNGSLGSWTTLA